MLKTNQIKSDHKSCKGTISNFDRSPTKLLMTVSSLQLSRQRRETPGWIFQKIKRRITSTEHLQSKLCQCSWALCCLFAIFWYGSRSKVMPGKDKQGSYQTVVTMSWVDHHINRCITNEHLRDQKGKQLWQLWTWALNRCNARHVLKYVGFNYRGQYYNHKLPC